MEKVTYIGHSGFLLETKQCMMLFDYYEGEIPEISQNKKLLVLASHAHHDHFNPSIFKLAEHYDNIEYILSDDIPSEKIPAELEGKVTFVSCDKEYDFALKDGENLHLTTLKSTDEGVAFLITLKERCYYHAGDLNLWIWEGESKAYNEYMKMAYFTQLEKLRNRKIDIAFVPLDPRQEHNAGLGLTSFLETTKTNDIFPMHLWGEYRMIEEYLDTPEHACYREQVRVIHGPGEVFEVR